MAHLVAAEIVVPEQMDPRSKETLIEELYAVHCRIFDGVDKESFVRYVVDSKAEHTWIQLYRGEGGELAGYFALHIFEKKVGHETVAIVRGETGIVREYRGANIVLRFGMKRAADYMLRHPGRRMYYLGSLVHPSSYAQIERFAPRVFPNAGVETPADVATLMVELGEMFGLARVDESCPLVRKVGWRTRDSALDQAYWAKSNKASVRFFLEANPGYVEGHGLLTFVPITLRGVLRGASRHASATAKKRAQKVTAKLRRGILSLLPAASQAAA